MENAGKSSTIKPKQAKNMDELFKIYLFTKGVKYGILSSVAGH